MKINKTYLFFIIAFLMQACYSDESLNVPVNQIPDPIQNELDQYIDENFTQEYGIAVRYRYVDRFINPGQRVTPPKMEVVRPMLDFIEDFWIGPFEEVENGEEFFRNHVPAEIVFFGGVIYESDGTAILGTADAGAQISLLDVNSIDLDNEAWLYRQLNIIYHEFAHIVHQRYKLPPSFETIIAEGYSGENSWFNVFDWVERGFVSAYATASPNEDFAETVSFYLFDPDFEENYLTLIPDCDNPDCEAINEGIKLLQVKVNSVLDHYEKVTGVSLEEVRERVQDKLN